MKADGEKGGGETGRTEAGCGALNLFLTSPSPRPLVPRHPFNCPLAAGGSDLLSCTLTRMMSLPLPRPASLALAALLLFTVHAQAQRNDTRAPAAATRTDARPLKLIPHRVSLSGGRSFSLNLPEGFAV